jgi:hypothetical protein
MRINELLEQRNIDMGQFLLWMVIIWFTSFFGLLVIFLRKGEKIVKFFKVCSNKKEQYLEKQHLEKELEEELEQKKPQQKKKTDWFPSSRE